MKLVRCGARERSPRTDHVSNFLGKTSSLGDLHRAWPSSGIVAAQKMPAEPLRLRLLVRLRGVLRPQSVLWLPGFCQRLALCDLLRAHLSLGCPERVLINLEIVLSGEPQPHPRLH